MSRHEVELDVRLFNRGLPEDGLRRLLGRHQVHDPRSRNYAVAEPTRWPDPGQSVVHQRYGPLWDQGRIGDCVLNACLGALMTTPLWRKGWAFTEIDCTALYQLATQLDDAMGIPGQYPPTDTGTCFLAGAQALQARHLITSYQHAFGLKAALGALTKGPICVGIPWYDSMLTPTANGLVSISPNAQVAGGHEIEVSSLYVSEQIVGFPQSWGPTWGRNGWGFMTWATLDRLLSEGGDVGVLVP